MENKRPYGRGIFEKYAGVWYARWTDSRGRRHVQKAGAKATAIALYRRRKDEALRDRLFPDNIRRGVKFSDIARDAINQVERSGRRAGNLALVESWFRARKVADITPADVERELDALRARGLSAATRNRYKAAVSLIFTLAQRGGKAAGNPARLIKRERENNERTRYLTQDEEERLRLRIREIAPERECELDLALHTGLRKAEQYGARWEDVDLITGFITVPKGKGNKPRHVPLNSDARNALARLRARANGGALVCPGGMGRDGYWATRRWFDRALRAAGVDDFCWHDLRHTFASRLRMRGVELATIRDLLGHSTLNMVLRYAHLAPGYLRDSVDKIATVPAAEETTLPKTQIQ